MALKLVNPAVGVLKLAFTDDAEKEILFRSACTALGPLRLGR